MEGCSLQRRILAEYGRSDRGQYSLNHYAGPIKMTPSFKLYILPIFFDVLNVSE
jgi:hypothetical protein